MTTHVAATIRAIRRDLGLTQRALAARAGLTPAAVSQYEKGLRSPSCSALGPLAIALGITVDKLLGLRPPAAPPTPLPPAFNLRWVRAIEGLDARDLEDLVAIARIMLRIDRRYAARRRPRSAGGAR